MREEQRDFHRREKYRRQHAKTKKITIGVLLTYFVIFLVLFFAVLAWLDAIEEIMK